MLWKQYAAEAHRAYLMFETGLVSILGTIVQASISANRLPRFQERLTAGSMFSISGFDGLQILLSSSGSMSPPHLKRYLSQSHPCPKKPATRRGSWSTVTDPPEEKNRVMVTMKLDSDETVTLSLFDSQAVAFHRELESMRVDPKVIVETSINPKMVGGRLFLNATSGTHVYFDKETDSGGVGFYQLVARDTGIPSAAPLLKSYTKVEKMTIHELNNFVVSAASQEIDFMCTGRVVRVDTDKGWCYVACSKCRYLRLLQKRKEGYTFQVRVTAYNFTEHHKTFTVTRVAEDHGRLPDDDVDDNGGNNDDGDDKPPGDPTTDEFGNVDAIGGASSDGGTGTVSSAHKKTGVALSKGVKKAWVG
ncbi:Uncharacterized protein Rs2_35566 [Raphanus sativus]|nr:Uncharacterized protein Rs2_35566 [Raphanus sativus]